MIWIIFNVSFCRCMNYLVDILGISAIYLSRCKEIGERVCWFKEQLLNLIVNK